MELVLLFLHLFLTFFKIGLFGFGGGYAMISLIQGDVVSANQWMSASEFTDVVAVSQMTPGPIGINSATYCGYTVIVNAGYSSMMGVLGSFIASFAVVLPSFILMLMVCHWLMKYRKHPYVEYVFQGLRPAVVGLVAAASLVLMNHENFSSISENAWQFFNSIILFIGTFIGIRIFKISPIKLILFCAIAGLLLF